MSGADDNIDALCASQAAEQVVLASLNCYGKAGNLASHEKLSGVRLISGTGPVDADALTALSPGTQENNCLTATKHSPVRRETCDR
eukprot:NODE_22016_length_726_cov_2.307179.p1 GENE.NODE_22016_length_726_cov_2.307179~~NODE_22016_length_726_cov_2.307179.p1  ORF type:complete len:86 (-),score=17.00 NODE_22016_length_726_cov_2.307179:241-498(-)